MQFFNFNATYNPTVYSSELVTSGLDALLKASGFTTEVKLELFIMERNSILMRISNIADIFDSDGEIIYQQIQIKQLAQGLFDFVNGSGINYSVEIEELSLTGNQPYKTMASKRINWKTVDDNKVSNN